MQTFFNTYRWYILGAVVIVIGAVIFYVTSIPRVVPDVTTFQSGNFMFTYDRTYEAHEYGTGVVSVGGKYKDTFIPLVDVVRYKSDPDVAVPASFDAFVNKQATVLCGADASVVSVSCTNPVVTPYTNKSGVKGELMSMTLNERNLKTGTTSASTYGPIYVFNTTGAATADSPLRYQAVFVYPTFSSYLAAGTTSEAFVTGIASTLTVTK